MGADRAVLERAAAHWGVSLDYYDMWGNHHVASDAALTGILAALGVDAGNTEQVDLAIQQSIHDTWTRAFLPTQVVYEDWKSIPLHVPADRAGGSIKLEIEWEGGELQHHPYWLPELAETARTEIDGQTYLAKNLPLPKLKLGYHRIRIYHVAEPQLECFGEARFIVCPRKVHELDHRVAGLALTLYGLRSQRDWGCGDFTDLAAAVEHLARAGAQFVALNPLHAIPNRQPYNTSPYLPECSLYRNFIYIDVEKVPGYEALPGPEREEQDREIGELRASDLVEYERVAKLKFAALRRCFARFESSGNDPAFDRYITEQGESLKAFATYAALWRHLHIVNPDLWLWTDWPEEYRDPHSDAVRAFASEHADAVRFHEFLQWQIDEQIAAVQRQALADGMEIGLYHDLALATDRFGCDLWAFRDFYSVGARVGAPPDDLAPEGQDWGFPPPNKETHRADGYDHFVRSIRNAARHGGALRIDHVMRFFRLYWIPDGVPSNQGTYVRDNVEDLLGIIALESVRGNFLVIGEDLGTVEPAIRERLAEAGVLGYKLLWYERHPDGRLKAPEEYPERAAVSTTTHDLATLAGFFAAKDIEARMSAGIIDEPTYRKQCEDRKRDARSIEQALAAAGHPNNAVAFVLSTPCTVAIVNQEDLTGETDQQNVPATTWQHPNWRRKMRVPVEEMDGFAEVLRQHIEDSGRLVEKADRAGE